MQLSLLLLGACDGSAVVDAGTDAPAQLDAGPPPTVIPAELADEETLGRLASLDDALPVLDPRVRLAQQSSEDRGLGGPVSTNLLENGNRDMSHFVCLGAGSRFEGPNLIEDRFDLPECPEPYVRGAVLSRFEGSGALVRLWLTLWSIKTRPPADERLLIYVDDEETPRLDVPLAGAIDGTASELFAPPFGAAVEGHLAWYYPVVFGARLIVALDGVGPLEMVYHQSTALLDVAPVARRAPDEALPARNAARDSLLARRDGGTPESRAVTLAAGATETVFDLTGPRTIRSLGLRAASLDALREVRARVTYDDEAAPAVDVPLRELFAADLAPPSADAPRVAGSTEHVVLRLPMPFAARALVELVSERATETALTVEVSHDPGVPAEPFGRLHVERRETLGPAEEETHVYAEASGPGRLAGACFLLEGHRLEGSGAFGHPLNFLEGDERIAIDGTPAVRGTGTEDYVDGAFYFLRGPHATPFAQAWGATTTSETAGQVTLCRWHVGTNAVDFTESLRAELEIGPGDPSVLDRYRSVAFLYR